MAMLVKALGGPHPPPFNLTLINVGACNFKEASARGSGVLPPALSRLLQGPPAAVQLAKAPASGVLCCWLGGWKERGCVSALRLVAEQLAALLLPAHDPVLQAIIVLRTHVCLVNSPKQISVSAMRGCAHRLHSPHRWHRGACYSRWPCRTRRLTWQGLNQVS